MQKLPISLVLCGALFQFAGCSTLATLAADLEPEKFICDEHFTIPRVYSGMGNDIRFLLGNYQDKGVTVFDAPFSLVADTIVLPYTVYRQFQYGNLCNKKNGETRDIRSPNV